MSMIVARMQKMKAENLIGIGNHNQRKTKNHSNPDIDTSLSELNYDLVDRTDNYKKDIENFINENKSTTRAVNPPHRVGQCGPGLGGGGAPSLQPQQRRDALQVVLHPVVNLPDSCVLRHQFLFVFSRVRHISHKE